MSIAAPEQLVRPSITPAGSARIARLAETFRHATRPVWIHDTTGFCVYANDMAKTCEPRPDALTFDLVDHTGRLLGRIKTLAA